MFYLTGLLFLLTAVVAWAKNNVNHGHVWADRLCADGGTVCSNPNLLLFLSIVVGLLALYRAAVKQ